jgi:hypothetical protein
MCCLYKNVLEYRISYGIKCPNNPSFHHTVSLPFWTMWRMRLFINFSTFFKSCTISVLYWRQSTSSVSFTERQPLLCVYFMVYRTFIGSWKQHFCSFRKFLPLLQVSHFKHYLSVILILNYLVWRLKRPTELFTHTLSPTHIFTHTLSPTHIPQRSQCSRAPKQ